MKFEHKYVSGCACRSIADSCLYCDGTEWEASQTLALRKLVNAFAKEMKQKLLKQTDRGYGGWDCETNFSLEQIKQQLHHHIEKGDFVDVANLAAFAWNRGDQ